MIKTWLYAWLANYSCSISAFTLLFKDEMCFLDRCQPSGCRIMERRWHSSYRGGRNVEKARKRAFLNVKHSCSCKLFVLRLKNRSWHRRDPRCLSPQIFICPQVIRTDSAVPLSFTVQFTLAPFIITQKTTKTFSFILRVFTIYFTVIINITIISCTWMKIIKAPSPNSEFPPWRCFARDFTAAAFSCCLFVDLSAFQPRLVFCSIWINVSRVNSTINHKIIILLLLSVTVTSSTPADSFQQEASVSSSCDICKTFFFPFLFLIPCWLTVLISGSVKKTNTKKQQVIFKLLIFLINCPKESKHRFDKWLIWCFHILSICVSFFVMVIQTLSAQGLTLFLNRRLQNRRDGKTIFSPVAIWSSLSTLI